VRQGTPPVLGVQAGFPAIGHGATVVMTTGNGSAVLVDAGSGVTSAVHTAQLRALVAGMGVSTISNIHISHLHEDHYNRLQWIVELHRVPASALVVPDFMIYHSRGYRNTIARIAGNDLNAALGYTAVARGIDMYEQSRTSGYLTARYQQAGMVIEYVASEKAVEALRQRESAGRPSGGYLDAASALIAVRKLGQIKRVMMLGDLRGSTFADLARAMGEQQFNEVFRGVEVLSGFHHLGVVKTPKDVEGIMRVLRATGVQNGEVRLIVQTDDKQMRRGLVEAFTHLGVEVITVLEGAQARPANVTAETGGRTVRLAEPEVQRSPPVAGSELVWQRMQDLEQKRTVMRRHFEALQNSFGPAAGELRTAIEREYQRADKTLIERKELTLTKLLGPNREGSVRWNDQATFDREALNRNLNVLRQSNADSEVLKRNPQLQAGVERLVRDARLEVAMNVHVDDALRTGRTSPGLNNVLGQVDPGFRARYRLEPALDVVETHDRLRATFRSGRAVNINGEVAASGFRARGVGILLLAAELAKGVVEIVALHREDKERNRVDALDTAMWWWQHAAPPHVTARTSDGQMLRSIEDVYRVMARYRYLLGDQGIYRLKRETDIPQKHYKALERMRFSELATPEQFTDTVRYYGGDQLAATYGPLLVAYAEQFTSDAISEVNFEPPRRGDWVGFLLWLEENVRNGDDFQRVFEDGPVKPVRLAPGGYYPDGPWELLIWRNGSRVWVSDPQLTIIMTETARRVVTQTEAELAAIWQPRPPKEATAGGMMAADRPALARLKDRRPTGSARFKSGHDPKLYNFLDPDEFFSIDWLTDSPYLMVFQDAPTPEGYVLVAGLDYPTYLSIRSATMRLYDPAQSQVLFQPSLRTERQYRLLESIAQDGGKFVRDQSLDTGSGVINYWFRGANVSGLALAKLKDMDIEPAPPPLPVATPEPEPAATPARAPPPLVCSTFEQGRDAWRVVNNDGSRSTEPRHVVEPNRVNAFVQWEKKERKVARPPLDLIIVFDLTYSMNNHVEAMRKAAADVVKRLQELSGDVRLGLVGYGDHETDQSAARQLLPLTDELSTRIQAMNAWQTVNGGDTPEDLLFALKGALSDEAGWRKRRVLWGDAVRAIVVITDAPAKVADGKDFEQNTFDSIIAAARARAVNIHMLAASDAPIADGQRLAAATGGSVHTGASAESVVDAMLGSAAASVGGAPHYFAAPEKFLGVRGSYYGTSISFDQSCTTARGSDLTGVDLVLKGRDGELRLRAIPVVRSFVVGDRKWTRRAASLGIADEWLDGGTPAGRERIQAVLDNVQALWLRTEFHIGSDTCALDNVVLGGPRLPP
jgi:hypothetical protein